MSTSTEVLIRTVSSDLTIQKTELYDVNRMRWLLKNNAVSFEHKSILKKHNKRSEKGNQVSITYKLSDKCKDELLARLYNTKGYGLQCLPREIRSFLAEPYYWDIDIENAQPTILYQYANRRGWKCDNVKKFCESRNQIINELINNGLTRDEAKQRLIQIFYGSEYTTGLPEWIKTDLIFELKCIKANIISTNQKIYDKFKKRENALNSVVSYILQNEERECLLLLDEALKSKQRSLDVLIHDGGLVRKLDNEYEFPINILRYCEEYIYDKIGYKLRLAIKPLKTSFVMEEVTEYLDASIIVDDLYASRKFVELMGDNIVNDNGLIYIFDEECGIWSCNESIIDRKICEAGNDLIFKKIGLTGDIIYNYSGIVKNSENLKRKLPFALKQQYNFLETGRDKSKEKLLFKDGIYDFRTKTFTKGFDKNIVFDFIVPFEYPIEYDKDAFNFVHYTFFESPFDNVEVPAIYKHYLMRGIIGDYYCKKMIIGLGPSNSTKGTMMEFMKGIFGTNIGNFNGNSLLLRSGGETSKEMAWINNINKCRIAFGSEINSDKDSTKTIKINSELIKSIVSGGETLCIRLNHQEEKSIINRCFPILFANSLPEFSSFDDAIKNRIIPIQYNYSFVEHVTLPFHKQANTKIKEELKNEKYAKAMIHILIQEYNSWANKKYEEPILPECTKEFKDDIIESINMKQIIEKGNKYVVTESDDDFVPAKEVTEHIREHIKGINNIRLTLMYNEICSKSIQRKVNGTNTKMRTRIKLVTDGNQVTDE